MNSVFEYLCLRKPRLDYVSPPICCDFSGSGFPVIVLDPFGRLVAPTGLILSGDGNLTLSWDPYFGALCFNIYQAVDENNLDGEYVIIAECVEGNSFQLPEPGGYRVSGITVDGETELSTPIRATGGGGGCTPTIFPVGLNPISSFHAALARNSGIVVGSFGGTRPGYSSNGITKDIRTTVNSSPTQASQSGNTVTASAPFFSPGDEGKVIIFSTSEQAQITSVTSNLQVEVNPSQTVAITTFELRGNTLGGVLGIAELANSAGVLAGTEQAFNGTLSAFWLNTATNEIRNLGAVRVPFDINASNDLLIDETGGSGHRALIYDAGSQTFTDLGIFEVGSQTTPAAFNDSQVAAVNCRIALPFTHDIACRWAAGVLTSVHPVEAGDERSDAIAINSSGVITGSYQPSNVADPFQGFVNFGGVSTDIGNFGGEVVPTDINDSNTVIGIAEAGSEFIPFFWTSGGGLQGIPLLAGRQGGEANSINSEGWVVGSMYGAGNDVAFIYRNGVSTPLINLVPAGSGWTQLTSAVRVNNNKQITGFGFHSSLGFSGYLLTLCS